MYYDIRVLCMPIQSIRRPTVSADHIHPHNTVYTLHVYIIIITAVINYMFARTRGLRAVNGFPCKKRSIGTNQIIRHCILHFR